VWIAALIGAGAARGLLFMLGHRKPLVVAVPVLGLYGVLFFAVSLGLKLPEARSMLSLLSRRFGRL
jgi:putative peptidoglycan lipid II flippase